MKKTKTKTKYLKDGDTLFCLSVNDIFMKKKKKIQQVLYSVYYNKFMTLFGNSIVSLLSKHVQYYENFIVPHT